MVQLETVLVMEGSSFVHLLDEDRIPELSRIFSILCHIHIKGPRFIKELMGSHVKEVGKVCTAAYMMTSHLTVNGPNTADMAVCHQGNVQHAGSSKKWQDSLAQILY
jgi:hypothetical protein